MCSNYPTVLVDHTRNLSPLGLLNLKNDSLRRDWVHDYLLQSKRDLRIKHFKILESMPSN